MERPFVRMDGQERYPTISYLDRSSYTHPSFRTECIIRYPLYFLYLFPSHSVFMSSFATLADREEGLVSSSSSIDERLDPFVCCLLRQALNQERIVEKSTAKNGK